MDETDESLNQLFRALGDATRRKIIGELQQRDNQSLFEIYSRVVLDHGIGLSRQAFSRHLTSLEAAQLIVVKWQGNTKLHSLNLKPLQLVLKGWMAQFEEKE